MNRTEFKANNEKEERAFIKDLKDNGYVLASDCMWVKIYEKGNNEVIIIKD